jgi:hypothetical protein
VPNRYEEAKQKLVEEARKKREELQKDNVFKHKKEVKQEKKEEIVTKEYEDYVKQITKVMQGDEEEDNQALKDFQKRKQEMIK